MNGRHLCLLPTVAKHLSLSIPGWAEAEQDIQQCRYLNFLNYFVQLFELVAGDVRDVPAGY